MKKILMIMALAIATVGAVSAQIGFKVDANASFSNFYGKNVDANMIVGYRAGVAAEIPFAGELSTGQFFFSPGLVFQSKGAKTTGIDVTVRSHHIKLPLLVGARFQFADQMGVSLQFGPYVAYGLSSKLSSGKSGESVNLYDALMKRFDAGATISAAFEYSQFYFQVGTDLGLTKIGSEIDLSNIPLMPGSINLLGAAKNIDFFVGLGYRF